METIKRVIQFRGKSKDSDEWLYGHYGRNTTSAWPLKDVIYPSADAEAGYLHYEEIDPATLGQYTGINDRNGKPIFEGDIVRISGSAAEAITEKERILMVDFGCDSSYAVGYGLFKCFDYEVIGNIYDNPELMNPLPTCGPDYCEI